MQKKEEAVRPLAISILEDNADLAKYMSILLTMKGYAVKSFLTAEQLLSALHRGDKPNCIITDFMIGDTPVTNTLQLIEPSHSDMKIILITAIDITKTGEHTTAIKNMLSTGVINCVVKKPFRAGELYGALPVPEGQPPAC